MTLKVSGMMVLGCVLLGVVVPAVRADDEAYCNDAYILLHTFDPNWGEYDDVSFDWSVSADLNGTGTCTYKVFVYHYGWIELASGNLLNGDCLNSSTQFVGNDFVGQSGHHEYCYVVKVVIYRNGNESAWGGGVGVHN